MMDDNPVVLRFQRKLSGSNKDRKEDNMDSGLEMKEVSTVSFIT